MCVKVASSLWREAAGLVCQCQPDFQAEERGKFNVFSLKEIVKKIILLSYTRNDYEVSDVLFLFFWRGHFYLLFFVFLSEMSYSDNQFVRELSKTVEYEKSEFNSYHNIDIPTDTCIYRYV